jgi:hypothetical protein
LFNEVNKALSVPIAARVSDGQTSICKAVAAMGQFLKVTRSYWRGLFAYYEVADRPLTNNDREQFFGSYRYHERRCRGRKVTCPGTVVSG